MSCSCTGASISSRSGNRRTLPVRLSWSACSQGATDDVRSVAARTVSTALLLARTETTSFGPHLVRRDVDLLAVDGEVGVAHELTGLTARGAEAQAVDDVVEPHLEQAQQVLAGDALLAAGHHVVVVELLLEHLVVAARLLLLAQLQEVLGLLDAAAAVLARRVRAPFDGALVGEAALALEKELHASRGGTACTVVIVSLATWTFLDPATLARAAAVVRDRRHVFDTDDLEAGGLQRANGGLATGSRTAHEDLDLLQAVLHALRGSRTRP